MVYKLTFLLFVLPFWAVLAQELTLEEAGSAIGLKTPIAISKVLYFGDGGSIGMVLTDSDGNTIELCIDRHTDIDADGPNTNPKLIIGSKTPDSDKGKPISNKSPLAKAILTLCRSCLDQYSKLPAEKQASKEIVRYSSAAKIFIEAVESK